jgi:hypothetical protein
MMRAWMMAGALALGANGALAEAHGPDAAEKRNLAQTFIALNLQNQSAEVMGGFPADPVIGQLRIAYPNMTEAQESEVRAIFGEEVSAVNRRVMLRSAKTFAEAFSLEELRALVAIFEDETSREAILGLTNFMTLIQPQMQEEMQNELLFINGRIIGVFEDETSE